MILIDGISIGLRRLCCPSTRSSLGWTMTYVNTSISFNKCHVIQQYLYGVIQLQFEGDPPCASHGGNQRRKLNFTSNIIMEENIVCCLSTRNFLGWTMICLNTSVSLINGHMIQQTIEKVLWLYASQNFHRPSTSRPTLLQRSRGCTRQQCGRQFANL